MVPSAQRCAVTSGPASDGVVALPDHLCAAWGAQHSQSAKPSLIARRLDARAFPHFKLPAVGRRALII